MPGRVAEVAARYAGHYLKPQLDRRGGTARSSGKRPAKAEA